MVSHDYSINSHSSSSSSDCHTISAACSIIDELTFALAATIASQITTMTVSASSKAFLL